MGLALLVLPDLLPGQPPDQALARVLHAVNPNDGDGDDVGDDDDDDDGAAFAASQTFQAESSLA